MGETIIKYDATQGPLVTESLAIAESQGPKIALKPAQLRSAGLFGLWAAELLAAKAGFAPLLATGWTELPFGVQRLGAAQANLGKAKTQAQHDVATVYRGVTGIIRAVNQSVRIARDDTPRIVMYDLYGLDRAAIPALVVITLGAIGVSATWATAWWATKTKGKDVELESEKARIMATASNLANLAQLQFSTTGQVDPDIVSAMAGVAKREERDDWLMPLGLGVAATGVIGTLGVVAYRKVKAA